MEHITLLLGIVIVTALVFDFTNGFHDTANAMATTISTGALKPKTAVAMSAVLNLVGAFLSVEVAKTISGGIVNEDGLKTEVIFAALVGAILWNLLTWLVGLPSSSSHALFGGLIGAAVMSMGWSSINGGTVVTKILIPALAAPLVAGVAAMLATRLTYRIGRNTDTKATAKGYRVGQIASAGLVSLAHGTNDAQKTMGIITLALVTGGVLNPGANPPMWVIVSAGVAIALGTYLGGWRIIRTMGKGLTDLQPQQGFAAQTSAATVILASSHLGFSLSTTQSCSGAVMGAGLGRKGGVVRWSTATRMFVAWGLTLPAAGLVGAGAEFLTKQGPWGIAATAALLVGGSAVIWVLSRRNAIDHTNVTDDEVRTDGGVPAEPIGVVTTAIAAVTPPPAGTLAASPVPDTSVKAGVSAPTTTTTGAMADPARPATV
ncbi:MULTISPECIES: inorganic phosphate transporter [Streptomyces]|uniref:Phosphate transporter n=1 Tax=Streptomyces venezuelae TaxID=54571 RepID=A0A5P2B830_STRVZ|nr:MULTISPECIES: inorganic phosphate transporter [Streptomyces]MYY87210.1 inorganic phosphate transporter [Streptomyces sp. SID335]MYZ19112.1 inorganic phosphate transporter [Streptomyces sp. SID337]NDZ84232.1 inorganic phosphate transporter [Streptomyces sp. SID10115]NEB45451.1 inorganic phosphate transporter [Streptomyces sp. SID339]QES26436.1 phosphate transporter [Streptomyces venezuelae]